MEKLIIVTGATGGLGSKIVEHYLGADNVKLICTYRNEKKWNETFGECAPNVIKINTMSNSITDVANLCIDYKNIVVVLNAFSIKPVENIGNYDEKEVESAINVNILQQINLVNAVVSKSREYNINLKIVNLDSGAADFPLKGWGIYCASKSFVNAFLKVLQLENPEYEIVSVDPGVMDTSMQMIIRNTKPEVFDKVNDFIEYKNNNTLRKPSEVAKHIITNYIDDWKATDFREKV